MMVGLFGLLTCFVIGAIVAAIERRSHEGPHNGSGSSAAAICVHATLPTRIRLRRFCYTLL